MSGERQADSGSEYPATRAYSAIPNSGAISNSGAIPDSGHHGYEHGRDAGQCPDDQHDAARGVATEWKLYIPEGERVIVGSGSRADLEIWRHGEPTPWTLGLLVSAIAVAFCAGVSVGVYSLAETLAHGVGLVAVFILAPTSAWALWDLRFRPVWRWIVWGALTGLLAGVGSAVALFVIGQ